MTTLRQEGSSKMAPSTDCSASRLKGRFIPGSAWVRRVSGL